MNFWFWVSLPGWLVIAITAFTKLGELTRNQWNLRWQARRLGFIGAGTIAAVMILTPISEDFWLYSEPTWRSAAIAWSWGLVWMTADNQPPWYMYFSGDHRRVVEWAHLNYWGKAKAEFLAFVDSFDGKPSNK